LGLRGSDAAGIRVAGEVSPRSAPEPRTGQSADRLAFVLLVCAIAALACAMPAQSDTWWLLRTGEEIWKSGHVALHDTFTHTVFGRYWPNHEWLSQVLFYAAYVVGGMPMLTALCAAAVVAAWAIVWRMTPGEPLDRVLHVGAGAAFSTASWSLRPQVFTLALFALTLYLVVGSGRAPDDAAPRASDSHHEDTKDTKKHEVPFWKRSFRGLRDLRVFVTKADACLPPLFLLWANLHGGVAAGAIVIGAALGAPLILERRIDRRLLVVALLCFAATAATPLGPSLWREIPLSLQRLKTYDVLEWRAPSVTNAADLPLIASMAAVALLAAFRFRRLRERDTLVLALATLGTMALAMRSARNGALFFMCAAPLAGRLLSGAVRSHEDTQVGQVGRVGQVGWVGTVVAAVMATTMFVVYAWSRPLDRLLWYPVSVQMYHALQACDGPLYNRYDEGGYLIWFVRNRPVFIDSRQDPFPESLVVEQLAVEQTGDYRATFDRYGIACALTPAQSLLANRLRSDGWQPHDAGAGWVVYTRRPL
jgi:hypothetical protein